MWCDRRFTPGCLRTLLMHPMHPSCLCSKKDPRGKSPEIDHTGPLDPHSSLRSVLGSLWTRMDTFILRSVGITYSGPFSWRKRALREQWSLVLGLLGTCGLRSSHCDWALILRTGSRTVWQPGQVSSSHELHFSALVEMSTDFWKCANTKMLVFQSPRDPCKAAQKTSCLHGPRGNGHHHQNEQRPCRELACCPGRRGKG